MMPAVALIALGRRKKRPIPLPIPLILIWPLVGLALAVILLAQLLHRKSGRPPAELAGARTALLAFCQLRGLKVDVQTSDDKRVLVWFV